MNEKLEEAIALGFRSIAEAEAHQEWLLEQACVREQIHEAVDKANRKNAKMYDIRHIAFSS